MQGTSNYQPLSGYTLAHSSNKYGHFTHLANDEVIGYYYLQRGHPWEESVVKFNQGLLSKSKNVIDAGAHIGTHSIPYSWNCGYVYSFEAQAVMYYLLMLNLIENRCTNVIPLRMALGCKSTTAHINSVVADSESKGLEVRYDGEKKVNYGGLQLGKGGEAVPMIELDSLNLSNIGFMKADVEGSEPLVFYGSRATITQSQPIIMYEQNAKTITAEMIDDLGLNAEVVGFSIADYCVKHLGYSAPYSPDKENYYLFPPTHNITLRQLSTGKISAYQESACVLQEESGWKVKLGGRGEFPVYPIGESKIRCIFESGYHDAEVRDGGIHWDNGTNWSLK